MSKSTAARRLPNREAALEALYSDISAKSMFPFWAVSTESRMMKSSADGHAKGRALSVELQERYEPILFPELVTMDDSGRRSLILVNLGLSPPRCRGV